MNACNTFPYFVFYNEVTQTLLQVSGMVTVSMSVVFGQQLLKGCVLCLDYKCFMIILLELSHYTYWLNCPFSSFRLREYQRLRNSDSA